MAETRSGDLEKADKARFLSWLPIVAAIVFFIAKLLIISPAGDFPLNDDYSYGLSVRHFLETGELKLFASCTGCFVQIALGTLFCLVQGFSFSVLREVNLLFSFATIFAIFLSLRELKVDRALAGLVSLLWVVNPINMNLEFSFMTDTAATSLVAMYIFFFLRGLARDSGVSFLVSALILSSAIMSRQSSLIMIPVNLVVFVVSLTRKKKTAPYILTTILLPLMAAFASEKLLESSSSMLESYNYHKEMFKQTITGLFLSPLASAKALLLQLSLVGSYLGLFCLPLMVSTIYKSKRKQFKLGPASITGLVLLVAFIYQYLLAKTSIPALRNIWNIDQIGASSLLGQINAVSPGLGIAFVILSGIGLALISFNLLYARSEEEKRSGPEIYCLLLLAVTLSLTVINTYIRGFDRYILDAFLPALICLGLSISKSGYRISIVPALMLTLAFGFLAMSQQFEYMNWNRARWKAIRSLIDKGVDPRKIDGGAEYALYKNVDFWKDFEIGVKHFAPMRLRGRAPANAYRWWPVFGDDYVIALEPLEGYRLIDSFPFSSLGSRSQKAVLVLKYVSDSNGESAEEGRFSKNSH